MLSEYNSPAETLIKRRDSKLQDIGFSFMEASAYIGLMLILITNHFYPFKGNLWVIIICCGSITFYHGYKAYKQWKNIVIMNKGIDAERDVGHFLQQNIAPLGYRVLNSLNRNNHDIDHVIIGSSGVYCIETKNLQWKKENSVEFNSKDITINGKKLPHNNPIKQAKSAALEVQKYFQSKNINIQFVTPVVMLPSRTIIGKQSNQLIVSNMKLFQQYILDAKPVLSAGRVKYAADILSHFNS